MASNVVKAVEQKSFTTPIRSAINPNICGTLADAQKRLRNISFGFYVHGNRCRNVDLPWRRIDESLVEEDEAARKANENTDFAAGAPAAV